MQLLCGHCVVSNSVLKIKSWVDYYFQNKLSLIVQVSRRCIAQVLWKVVGTCWSVFFQPHDWLTVSIQHSDCSLAALALELLFL